MGRKPAQAGQVSGGVKPLDERSLSPRPSSVASPALSSRSDTSETWRRVLWDNADGHEDCHVDEASFLQGLKMNYYAEVMEYWDIVWSTMALTQQCALVVTYLLCFFDLHQGGTSSATLTAVSSVLFALSFVFGGVQTLNAYESAATAVLLMFFTPVLASLTKAWTDDTLTAMCVLFLFVHVAASDYRTSASRERESAIASSSALFTAVLLASRLQRPSDAFVMIMLGVVTFIVAEEPRRKLRVYSPYTWGCLTLLLHVVGSLWLSQRSTSLAALYSASIILITFVVPTYFRYLQKVAKQQISGPWDEARPKNSLAAAQWATAGLIGRTRKLQASIHNVSSVHMSGNAYDYTANDTAVHLNLETCSTRDLRQAISKISRTLEARLDAYERNNYKLVKIIKQWEGDTAQQLRQTR